MRFNGSIDQMNQLPKCERIVIKVYCSLRHEQTLLHNGSCFRTNRQTNKSPKSQKRWSLKNTSIPSNLPPIDNVQQLWIHHEVAADTETEKGTNNRQSNHITKSWCKDLSQPSLILDEGTKKGKLIPWPTKIFSTPNRLPDLWKSNWFQARKKVS